MIQVHFKCFLKEHYFSAIITFPMKTYFILLQLFIISYYSFKHLEINKQTHLLTITNHLFNVYRLLINSK